MSELWRRLLHLVRRRRFDRDLEDEIAFHLDMKARENREAGLDAEEARFAARRQFGNPTLLKETSRDAWRWRWLDALAHDIRYALRAICRTPGFSTVVVLTLALGIGANTAIFSFVDRLLLRPLPFPESHRLASLYVFDSQYFSSMSYPDYLYYRDHSEVFSGLAGYAGISDTSLRLGTSVESLAGEAVSANYFSVLGISPVIGRAFRAEEDAVPGRNPVVILGYNLWQTRFSADPGVLGRQLVINDTGFTVIGVAPRGFAGLRLDRGAKPEFWVPTMMYPVVLRFAEGQDLQHYWGNQWVAVTGRLKPGVTMERAEANIATLTASLKQEHWLEVWKGLDASRWTTALLPANAARFSPHYRAGVVNFLALLSAAVATVLLIACANVAGLMLARALRRQREIGVRLALGAGRGRLLQQLMAESLLLSLMGGAAGLVVALFASQYLASERPFKVSLLLETGLDARVLAWAFILSILTGVLFGAAPVRQAFRVELIPALKTDAARSGGRRFGLRDAFVAVQVALSVVLLAGAGLFVRTLRNARSTDVTLNPGNVLLMHLDAGREDDAARRQRFYSDLVERLHALPGVEAVALVNQVPMGGRRNARPIIPRPGGPEAGADFNIVSGEYFGLVGLPVLRGRGFDSHDRTGSPEVTVINEQMLRRFWPGEDPIGKRFGLLRPPRLIEVVGVVRDGRFRNYRDTVRPCFYLPLAQNPSSRMSLEVRTAGDPRRLAAAVRSEIAALDAGVKTGEVRTLESYREAGLGQERLSAALLSGLGVLAVVLAAIGLYGVLAFSVAQRTREIGIRMALGATSARVLRSVAGRALLLIVAGACCGLAAALLLTRLVSGLLFGISATDPLTYTVVTLVLAAVGMAAAFIPARRATKIDPLEALRYE